MVGRLRGKARGIYMPPKPRAGAGVVVVDALWQAETPSESASQLDEPGGDERDERDERDECDERDERDDDDSSMDLEASDSDSDDDGAAATVGGGDAGRVGGGGDDDDDDATQPLDADITIDVGGAPLPPPTVRLELREACGGVLGPTSAKQRHAFYSLVVSVLCRSTHTADADSALLLAVANGVPTQVPPRLVDALRVQAAVRDFVDAFCALPALPADVRRLAAAARRSRAYVVRHVPDTDEAADVAEVDLDACTARNVNRNEARVVQALHTLAHLCGFVRAMCDHELSANELSLDGAAQASSNMRLHMSTYLLSNKSNVATLSSTLDSFAEFLRGYATQHGAPLSALPQI